MYVKNVFQKCKSKKLCCVMRPNIKPTLIQCLLFARLILTLKALPVHKKIPCNHSNTPRLMQWLYMCQVSRQLIKNKNDLLKFIKPKWPLQPRFQFHMKTDKTNRLADPENLYIYQVSREFCKKRPFWLSVEPWNSNQVISILMGNFT